MERLLRVGVITTTHGLKGEVKVYPTTDGPERFLELDEVILKTGNTEKPLQIERVRFFKNLVIVKFKGLDRIEDVETLRQAELYVTRENAAPLNEGEYYIGDLIDMRVFLESGEDFGVIKDVIQTGANDVYVVQTEKYGEVLIPAIPHCVTDVDIANGKMTVRLMKGLLPEQR